MSWKVGDRFVFIGPISIVHDECITGYLTHIEYNRTMHGFLDSDDDSFKGFGPRYYGKPEDNYIIPEEVYNSPLFKALNEDIDTDL